MRARLSDIARHAGVSEATVSRVLNDRPGVGATTKQAVLTALDVLGYERPAALRQHSAGLIGLVVPELENPIFPVFAQVISTQLANNGYTPILCTQSPGGVTEDEYVDMLRERRVAGIVFVSGLHADTTSDVDRYRKLADGGLPLVFLNGYVDELPSPCFSCDDTVAAKLAVDHLLSLGHRRIGLVSGPERFIPVQRKRSGYLAALENKAEALVELTMFGVEGGAAAAARLLDSGATGIVCGSDLMALGAIREARSRGLTVPGDVSIVGYDDSPLIAHTDPPLTTLRQPVRAMALAAVRALLDEIAGHAAPSTEYLFRPELVVRASTGTAVTPLPEDRMSQEWWRDAVIYQVYPRSFADADGDGVGDLPGIRAKIPYLAKLGIDAMWLSPFYTSPMCDGGYDVADFRDIDPMFGDLSDFDAMVTDAHAAGLKVIVDIVPNHCSVEHEWFKAALAAGPGSPERELFHFRDSADGPPNNWQSIFGGPAWTQVPDGQWYLHLFDSGQPDFNWDRPEVRAEFLDVLRFWLDRGVDGFRVDVAHGMVKEPGLPDFGDGEGLELLGSRPRTPYLDVDGVHEIYRDWRRVLDSYDGDRMAVAEAWVETPERRARYVRDDELHQAFNFDLLMAGFTAAEYRKVIDAEISMANSVGAAPTWVLSNHDRKRHVTRFGDGETGLARARAATLTMLALPGSAYLYQGEELGLPEVLDLPEDVLQDPVWERSGRTERGRDGCRVPLPWEERGPSFGFGANAGWLPQPDDWGGLSAAAQDGAEGSTLEFYRAALRLRREHRPQALIWDGGGDGDVLSFSNGTLRCVTNFGDGPVPLDGEVVTSSAPIVDGRLPGNAAAWVR